MLPSVDGPGVATTPRSPQGTWFSAALGSICQLWNRWHRPALLFAQEMGSQEGACSCPLLSVPGS